MGKFEVGHWMGAKKEEWGMREREQKYFGPVPAFFITGAVAAGQATTEVIMRVRVPVGEAIAAKTD